jgi:ABC-2 type transport system permease protein
MLWTTAFISWRLLDHVAAVLLLPVLQRQGQPVRGREQPAEASARLTMAWWMCHPFRAALVKDLLLVARDPMQWTQAVVFFGLLGAYFANIHRLAHFSVEPTWRIGVASLNLACTLLVFGSLSVRFVFPQISLEGRSLWLLRLAPHGTRRLMHAKLCLYGAIALIVVEGLLWLSAGRLEVPMPMRWWLAGVGLITSLTIVGLTVGLGAWWVDPTAQDAARVVSSSTGALVLVLMLGYVGCVVAALVAAWTSWATGSWWWLFLSSLGLVLVSLLAGWVPVRRGLVRLEHLEHSG